MGKVSKKVKRLWKLNGSPSTLRNWAKRVASEGTGEDDGYQEICHLWLTNKGILAP